jgi:hypothetical protein
VKFHPLTGYGGNAAIETAAALVNHLLSNRNLNWSDSEINAAFSAAQMTVMIARHGLSQTLTSTSRGMP